MLIRTRQNECKYRVAAIVRLVLFFGIPSVYLLILSSNQWAREEPNTILFESGKKTLGTVLFSAPSLETEASSKSAKTYKYYVGRF